MSTSIQTLLIAGDFCPRSRVAKLIEQNEGNRVFADVESIVKNADFSVVNLEYSLKTSDATPLTKCGPNLSGSPESIKLLHDVGFDMVTLANNHIYDYGDEGLKETIKCCNDNGLSYIGAGRNLTEATEIRYININSKTIAVINCCESEFSIATDNHYGANPLNPIRQYHSIVEANKNSDYVIVIVHGGHEHYPLPSPRMQETYRFFIDSGADAVINHHQHCFSGYEIYNEKPIFYGLGNFCFDAGVKDESPLWFDGFIVKLTFIDDEIQYVLYPYTQCKDTPDIVLMNERQLQEFNKRIERLNEIIANPQKLKQEHLKYMNSKTKTVRMFLEPYNHSIFIKLYRRGLLPSLFNKTKRLILKDYVNCESHLDVLRNALQDPIL